VSRLLRAAQAASLAGQHEAAARLFVQARRAAPGSGPVCLQEALAEARAGHPETGLKRLAEAPEAYRATPPARLVEGWLLARVGRSETACAKLAALCAQVPANRVAATALAYARLRGGDLAAGLKLLADPGDNFEILSWAWLELERLAAAKPLKPETPPPPPDRGPGAGRRAARRWFAAGQAAAAAHVQSTWRRRLLACRLAAPLHPLLRLLEGPWPTDALEALQRARATGCDLPGLAFALGAQLLEHGHPAAALAELDRATAELEAQMARLGKRRAEFEAGEEACLVRLYRAAALVELRRWDPAEQALKELADLADDAAEYDAGRTHEFALPDWYLRRARVRLARGQRDGARADLERALEGDPGLFLARLAVLKGELSR
jgi:tetratricopeptide (TPR) repeat protein